MIGNYFFIDGSALLAQIRNLQKARREFSARKLDPLEFIYSFMRSLDDLGVDEFKRAVYYFPLGGDVELKEFILMPSLREPGLVRDVNFKFCGDKLKQSQAFTRFVETVPQRWQERCTKSEKGIDIEICCDALKLAAAGKLERLLLLTNDRDFIPLCRTLKDFGVNVSLIHLSDSTNVNKILVKECDTYDVVPHEELEKIFKPSREILTVEPIPETTQELP